MMFKRLGVLIILIVLALVGSVPAVSARGQALATGSIWIHPQAIGNDIHINFNARGVNFVPADEDYPWDHYEATGHLFWREGGDIDRVNIHHLEIWEQAGILCTYISGFALSGPRAGQQLCFMFCENNFVLGAAWDGPPAYFFGAPVLSGNVVIKE
jgi:hypothetical protein